MSDDLERYFADRSADGETGETAKRELLAATQDPERGRRLKELLIIDDALSQVLSPNRTDFPNRVLKRTQVLDSQRHFVDRVEAATAADAGRARPRMRGPSRRRTRRADWTRWVPLAAASALLIGLGIVAIARGGHERQAPEATYASLVSIALVFPQAGSVAIDQIELYGR